MRPGGGATSDAVFLPSPILFVDQRAAQALAIADRAYALATGSVVRSGPASVLAGSSEVKVAYLGE